MKVAVVNARSLALTAIATAIAIVSSSYSARILAAAGSAPVTVVNTPLPVMDASVRTPFQALLCTPGCQGGGSNDPTTKVHVPANARLVIEYVSVYCGTVINFVEVVTHVGGVEIGHFPGVPAQSRPGGPFISAQTVRIYADPDTDVTARQDVPSTLAACNMQLSGYTTEP